MFIVIGFCLYLREQSETSKGLIGVSICVGAIDNIAAAPPFPPKVILCAAAAAAAAPPEKKDVTWRHLEGDRLYTFGKMGSPDC